MMAQESLLAYTLSQRRAIVICVFITIGAFQFGYDTSYFSGILAMQPFVKLYGHLDSTTGKYVLSSRIQSITSSIINVGEFVGAISSFVVGDHLGRRGGLFVSSACVIIGTILQVADTNIGSLIAGRLVLGYAVGLISCLVPLYVADCAPARLRGALVSMYQFCIGLGLLLGVIVDNASKDRTDSGAFRIPMAVQFVFPLILIPGLLFVVPESPRWLMMKSRQQDARMALVRLHGQNNAVIEQEIADMAASYERDLASGKSTWREVFNWGPEGRKAYLGFALQAFQQATGINFITGYGIVFFIQIGITNPFIIQLGLYLVAMPAVWLSQYCIERFGRRPILVWSGLLTSIVLLVAGACGLATAKSRTLEQTIVAMVYLFLVVFNLGWGPTVWVVTSEISTGKNRGKLMSLSTGSNWFFNWLVSFTFPYLFNTDSAGLGARVGFIYGALTLAAVVWVFIFLPETAGLSLEEIHKNFEQRMPARKFQKPTHLEPSESPEESMHKEMSVVQVEST